LLLEAEAQPTKNFRFYLVWLQFTLELHVEKFYFDQFVVYLIIKQKRNMFFYYSKSLEAFFKFNISFNCSNKT